MKLIIAIIKPDRLEAVKQELYKRDINLMTVSEVLGHGRQMGVTEIYRGAREMGNLLRKIRLEIAVNEDYMEHYHRSDRKRRANGRSGGRQDIRPRTRRMRPDPNGRKGPEGNRVEAVVSI